MYLPQTEPVVTTPVFCKLKLIEASFPHILPKVACPANVEQVSLTPIIKIDHELVTFTDRNILVNFLEVVIYLALVANI